MNTDQSFSAEVKSIGARILNRHDTGDEESRAYHTATKWNDIVASLERAVAVAKQRAEDARANFLHGRR